MSTTGNVPPDNPMPHSIAPDAVLKLMGDVVSKNMEASSALVEKVYTARQSFYERLLVVDSATLSLVFTVVGLVANLSQHHSFRSSDASFMIWACWLLIASAVACLVHNYFNKDYLTSAGSSKMLAAWDASRELISCYQTAAGEEPYPSTNKLSEESEQLWKQAEVIEKICDYVGLAAQVLTIIAYSLLALTIGHLLTNLAAA
jgi:hypothetical protein